MLNNGTVFKNNKEVEWVTQESFYENGAPLKEFETNRKGVVTGMVDLSVYSQRQNFRILGSTKYGKENPLMISPHDKNTVEMKEEIEILQASLVQNLESKKGNVEGIPNVQSYKQIKGDKNMMWGASTKPEIRDYLQESFKISGGKWKKMNESTILLATENNNYCEEAGRRHKRNNVYLLYNVKTSIIYKKCHKCTDRILQRERIPSKLDSAFKELGRKL